MRYLAVIFCVLAFCAGQVLYGGGGTYPIFAYPIFAMVAVAGLLVVFGIRSDSAPPLTCVVSVLALAGWLIWRACESPDQWLASSYLYLVLACVVMYVLFASFITSPTQRLIFLSALFVLALGQVAFGAWQFSHHVNPPFMPWFSEKLKAWYGVGTTRARGLYLNANHLVWFLNAMGLFAASACCWARWKIWAKVMVFYVALVSFAGMAMTASRGGLLSLGVGLAVFFFLSALILAVGAGGKRGAVLLLNVVGLAVIVGSVGLLYSGSYAIQDRMDALWGDDYRSTVFAAGLRQLQLNPIFGTGAGSFMFYGRLYREWVAPTDDIHAHNDWLQLGSDFGLPAIILLVIVVLVHGVTGVRTLLFVVRERMARSSRAQSDTAAVLIGALSCLAVFATHSFFDFNMQIPANALLAAACLGMIANGDGAAKRKMGWSKRFAQMLSCVAAISCAVWLGLNLWRGALPELYYLQAENAFYRGREKEAQGYAEKGLALKPDSSALQGALGQIYLWKCEINPDPDEQAIASAAAIQHFAEAARLSPNDQNTPFLKGVALYRAGRYLAAQKPLVEALSMNATDARCYDYYGMTLEALDRLEEAQQIYGIAATFPGGDVSRKRLAVVKRILWSRSHL